MMHANQTLLMTVLDFFSKLPSRKRVAPTIVILFWKGGHLNTQYLTVSISLFFFKMTPPPTTPVKRRTYKFLPNLEREAFQGKLPMHISPI